MHRGCIDQRHPHGDVRHATRDRELYSVECCVLIIRHDRELYSVCPYKRLVCRGDWEESAIIQII